MRLPLWILACTFLACSGEGETDTSEGAATGPAGIEFETVPVETTDCNATVLRGTKRFAGRGYVLPQAYVGTNIDGRPLFEVFREGDKYRVRLGVYFHAAGEEDTPRALSNRKIKRSCGSDELKAIVNKNRDARERIESLQPLPVNDIAVELKDEVKGTQLRGSLSNNSVSMLGYVGRDHVFEFTLPDRASYKGFLTRLRGPLGVPILVKFQFTAQQSEFLQVKVDFSGAEDALAAEFKAAPPFVTRAAFRTHLARVMSNMQIEIVSDGASDGLTKVSSKIIDELILNNPNIKSAVGATDGTKPQAEPAQTGDDAKISVSAALSALRTKKLFELKLENSGKAESVTYGALSSIRADDPGANAQELRLYTNPLDGLVGLTADERAQDWGVWGRDLERGQTIRIMLVSRRIYVQRYTYATKYFRRKSDLLGAEHRSSMTLFPEIERYEERLVEPPGLSGDARLFMPKSRFGSWLGIYYWGYQDIVAEDGGDQEPASSFGAGMIRELKFVTISTDQSGRSYPLGSLDKVPGPWTVKVDEDTNSVSITAKEPIERIRLTNRESFDKADVVDQAQTTDELKTIVRRRYFKESRGIFGGFGGRDFISVGSAKQLPRIRSEIVIRISASDDGPPQRVTVTDSSRGVRAPDR